MRFLTDVGRLPERSPAAHERAGLVLVVLLFGAPMFVGLDRWDLDNDEAIYAYAVDRILETGEWLTPRSIEVDGPFLEKPPLKFWIVAGLMKAGVLPRNELGMRLLDAVFGMFGFIYVYLFGARLGGVLCGFASALSLFAFSSLIFEHGLRSNNMEAPLFLCYCGGMYHLARWIEGDGRPSVHAAATAALFVLGFMTKFVAAIFLPVAALIACAWIPEARARLRGAWRTWIVPLAAAGAASSAWFLYETAVHGRFFWDTILGLHVVTRFTSALDPTHLHPWSFYVDEAWSDLARSGGRGLALAAVIALALSAWRGRPWQMRLIVAWWAVPFALISAVSSKLFHYAYPFLPGLAIAMGWLAAAIYATAARSHGIHDLLTRLDMTSWGRTRQLPLRQAAWVIAAVAFSLAILTAAQQQVSWHIGGVKVFQNSSVLRPGLIGALALAATGQIALSSRLLGALTLVLMLPAWNYPHEIARVLAWNNPLQVTARCASRVRAAGRLPGGVYNAAHERTHHGHYYYLSRLGRWDDPERPDEHVLRRRLFSPGEESLVRLPTETYRQIAAAGAAARGWPSLPDGLDHDGVTIVMPGPYQACVADARAARLQLAHAPPLEPVR